LSPQYKSKFISRGYYLTHEEFEYLLDNNMKDLINQYLNTGLPLEDEDILLIKNNPIN